MSDVCLPLAVTEGSAGDQVTSYKVATDLAMAGSDDHDKIVTTAKKTSKVSVNVSSYGCGKFEIGTWDGTTFTVAATIVTRPGGDSNECCEVCFDEITGDATNAIRIRAHNTDAATNFYSSMCFLEK